MANTNSTSPTISPTLQPTRTSSFPVHKHQATAGDVTSAIFILLFMVMLVVGSMYYVYKRERRKNEEHQRSGGIGGVYKANDMAEQAEIEEHDFSLNKIIQLELNGTGNRDNWRSRIHSNTTSLSSKSFFRDIKDDVRESLNDIYTQLRDRWNDGWSVLHERSRRDSGGSSEELM